MRLNVSITPEHREILKRIIAEVNTERRRLGLEDVHSGHVINDMIERMGERSTYNLCGVFVLRNGEQGGVA